MKQSLISLLLLLSCGSVSSQNNVGIKYFVTFYAYPIAVIDDQTPGHVIIAFGKEDNTRQMSSSDGAWGFYPKGVSKKVVNLFFDGKVQTGLVRMDSETLLKKKLIEARLTKSVSAAEYQKAYSLIKEWNSKMDYHLTTHNCVHFGYAIAQAINLKLPRNVDYKFPENFLKELVKLNP